MVLRYIPEVDLGLLWGGAACRLRGTFEADGGASEAYL